MHASVFRWIAVAAGAVVAVWISGLWLPDGLPLGVVVQGLVLGGLSAMTALGLVLVYRSSRIINFAQAEIGGMAASVAIVMVLNGHLSYFLAVPVGLVAALLTGWLVDATVVKRFFSAPRLILTVATIGLAQILGAAELFIPSLGSKSASPFTQFTTPFHITFHVGPQTLTGNHVVALVVMAVVLVGLGWFFARTDTGVAVRGAADSSERALLLGIPVRRLSRVTWILAAGLSGVGAILAAPIHGANLGAIAGPEALLPPLAAAVIARMESLPVTVAASLAIGVFQQAVFWEWPRSSTSDVALFAAVLLALLFQRRRTSRAADNVLSGFLAAKPMRPIPLILKNLPEVRTARWTGWALLAVLVLAVPPFLNPAQLTVLAYVPIYGIIAVSLVILVGWAGQISLGQFAFVGVGAATTGFLLLHAHTDMFVALFASALVGAAVAAAIGVPALRIPGLYLAVTTLAFGVPVATFLLNSSYFPSLNPARVQRPTMLDRISLNSNLVFYFVCLGALVLALAIGRNFRRSRAGRVVLAIRDNERAAASFGVEPVRVKLAAFSISGGLAGLAGGLFAIALRGVPFDQFSPNESFIVFTMVIVGGVTTLSGAVLGAAYVEAAQHFLHGALQLLATGAGLLILLMFVPGGLVELGHNVRDRLLRIVADRRGLSVPSLSERPDELAVVESSLETAPPPEPITAGGRS